MSRSRFHMSWIRVADAIVFEIDHAGVQPPIDSAFTEALQDTLSEWNSAVDDEAYANL